MENIVKILQQLNKRLDIPYKVITVNSSCFIAWANSFFKRANPDEGTEKSLVKGWFFGYMIHLAVDTTMELTIAIIFTLGNRYDGHELRLLLEKVITNLSRQIQAVTASKGYDAGYNYLDIVELFQTMPIISKHSVSDPLRRKPITLDQFFVVPERISPTATG